MRFLHPRLFTFGSLAVACALLSACDSSDNAEDAAYFLRFRANGTQVEYTDQLSLMAVAAQAGAQHTMMIATFDASNSMTITAFDTAPIAEETYSGYTLGSSGVVGAQLIYKDASGAVYSIVGTTPDHSITITRITSTSVEGTFRGTLKPTGQATGQADVSITNGAFRARRGN